VADSPLAKKLALKPNYRALIVNAPPGYREQLGPLPDGVELREAPTLAGTRQEPAAFDWVQLFARNQADLQRDGAAAIAAVKPGGWLWIAYPKQRAKVPTDITRDRGWDVITAAGWQGGALVSVDDIWSAMRFRPQPAP
jgi:hypothetical protein